ncbi:MAG TPA: hypothetical protein DCP04_17115, partial [Klebsiella pneumoniae]|nr:hypothetical protein [Klebsiella pneumoniae]
LRPASRPPAGEESGPGTRHSAGGGLAPDPASKPKAPRVRGLLKLPVLAASTALRRSRQAGAARMDAG